MAALHESRLNGNGYTPPPQSRKAFQRSLPGRLGGLEDSLDVHDDRIDQIVKRIAAIESCIAAIENRIEDKTLAEQVELGRSIAEVYRRVFRSRRRPRRRVLPIE